MSRAKLALISFASTVSLSSTAWSQENVFQLPVNSSPEIEYVTSARLAVVAVAQESEVNPPATAETLPDNSNQATPRRNLDKESDATKVPQPTVADPPISLGDLKVSNIALSNIGTGNIPDDETDGRLPKPIPLPMGPDRGLYLYYTKPWAASGFYHQPLYFEDAMLERHGHERFPMLQPFISMAKFYGTIPLAPYKWTLQGPLEERHVLGSFRPGSPAPIVRQRLPYDQRAIRNQIGASAAAAVAIP